MKRQSYLIQGLAPPGWQGREDGALVKWRYHVNKGKQYPYASERQNTRVERFNRRWDAKINAFLAKHGIATE